MPIRYSRFANFVLLFVLLAGCSGEKRPAPGVLPAGTGEGVSPAAPSGATGSGSGPLRIDPADVYRGTAARLAGTDSLPAGATVEWLVNGAVAQTGASALETSGLRKGDTIQVRATGRGGTAYSPAVKVKNSLPRIVSARFVLGEGPQGSGIGVEAETGDADGDDVQVEIAWKRNGESAGTGSRLPVPVKRGDRIDVTVTPFDGEERGRSATITRQVGNTPPVIEGQEEFLVNGNVVTFRIRASDPDGDRLAYSIKDAPAGMKIDPATGWVRWETVPGTVGKVPFMVKVSDGSGGESTAGINVTITEQAPAGPP